MLSTLPFIFLPNKSKSQTIGIGISPLPEKESLVESIPQRATLALANSTITGLVSLLHENSF